MHVAVNLLLYLSYLGQDRDVRLKITDKRRESEGEGEHLTWCPAVSPCGEACCSQEVVT